ncbi:OmpA family protein [Echinicola jeungdonensis]|uniref:OmpA family protein n=1 Tax=Echinicola jeungdonensis TaxID=709343 RepID=A0ABV5J4L2_9BACT|nr:OmpA family protein [Echinicola jeungdonensis]MDN3668157.1 OmpA family protein [Echinicola jeungdonensis]
MKRIWLILLFLIISPLANAQLQNYKWRIGFSGGYTNYYGDLTPHTIQGWDDWDDFFKLYQWNKNYRNDWSGQLSLETRLTNTTGLMLQIGRYQFAMSDRYMDPGGNLLMESPHFDRALNFQTTLWDAGLSLVFKTDNDKLLSRNAFIAPYLTLGFGGLWFDVKGDLLDAQGNQYDYSQINLIPDGTYETSLPQLNTERPGGYELDNLYSQLGLGIRFKLSNNLELFVQSEFKHAFTDYLDDVSETYREEYENDFQAYAAHPGTNTIDPSAPFRGNRDGANDWYIYHGAGLKINFSPNKKTFNASSVSSRKNSYPSTSLAKTTPKAEIDSLEEKSVREQTNNFNYTFINWPSISTLENLKYRLDTLQIDLSILEQKRNLDRINESMLAEENSLQRYELSSSQIQQDTLLSGSVKKERLETINDLKSNSQKKIDSLSQKANAVEFRIGALEQKKQILASTKSGLDSLSILHEFQWVTNILPITQDSTIIWNRGLFEPPSSKMAITPDSLPPSPTPKEYRPSQNLMTYSEIQEPPRSSKTDSLLQVLIGLQVQSESLEPEEFSEEVVETEEDDEKKSRFPIRLFSGRSSDRGNRSSSRTESQSASRDRETSLDISKLPSQEIQEDSPRDYENSNRAATIFGLSNLGLNLAQIFDNKEKKEPIKKDSLDNAALDTISTDTLVSREKTLIPPESINTRDTVYLEVPGKSITIPSTVDIYFDINQSDPSQKELEKLNPIAEYINQYPDKHIFLTGYADNTGSLSYNLKLIQERVDHLMEYLIQELGISPSQIQTESGGKIIRGPQKGANPKDRRVEVKINL